MIYQSVMVFAALFAIDFVWSRYTTAIVAKHAVKAASYSSAIILINGMVIVAYAAHPLLVIPAALGAWSGTWFAVKSESWFS